MHISKSIKYVFVFLIVSIVWSTHPGFAQPPQDDNIKVYAEHLIRVSENVLKGYGYVDVYYGDLRLRGDNVILNRETGEIEAQGHVILDRQGNRLVAERLLFNFKTKSGEASNGFGFISPTFYFEGDEIILIEEDKIRVKDGLYTTCQPPSNAWKLKATDTLIHIDNYVYLTNPSFWIQGIPVFYLPYLFFPVKTERTSGFLLPEFGSSNEDGLYVKNAYFWAISDSQDATLYLDLSSKKGLGKGLEYRYILGEKKSGILEAYHINENENSPGKGVHKDRGRFKFKGEHVIKNDYRLLANINLVSDNYYLEDYSEDTIERTISKVDSHFSATARKPSYTARLLVEHDRSLSRGGKDVLRRYPNLNFTATTQQLFGSSIYYGLGAQYDRFERDQTEKDQRCYRMHLEPGLLFPINLPGGFVFTPSIGLKETYYSEGPDSKDGFTRNMHDFGLRLDGPRLENMYHWDGFLGVKKMKCVVDPGVSYTFEDGLGGDNMNTPTFDFDWLDDRSKINILEYDVVTHFIVMNESSRIKELMRFKISQDYDIDEHRKRDDEVDKFNPRRPFSVVRMELDAFPFDFLSFSIDSNYNVYTDKVEFVKVDANYNYRNTVYGYLGWWYKDLALPGYKLESFLSAGISINIEPIIVSYNTRYNIEEVSSVENTLEVIYKSQCWGLGVQFSSLPGGETEFKVRFKLLGFGSISEELG